MASIRERLETVFAAMAFAEANCGDEAREIAAETVEKKADAKTRTARPDNRPRLRA